MKLFTQNDKGQIVIFKNDEWVVFKNGEWNDENLNELARLGYVFKF